jgi:hypothetical protein
MGKMARSETRAEKFINNFIPPEERVIARYITSGTQPRIEQVLTSAGLRDEWLTAAQISKRSKVPVESVRARIYQILRLSIRRCRRAGCSKEYQIPPKKKAGA